MRRVYEKISGIFWGNMYLISLIIHIILSENQKGYYVTTLFLLSYPNLKSFRSLLRSYIKNQFIVLKTEWLLRSQNGDRIPGHITTILFTLIEKISGRYRLHS